MHLIRLFEYAKMSLLCWEKRKLNQYFINCRLGFVILLQASQTWQISGFTLRKTLFLIGKSNRDTTPSKQVRGGKNHAQRLLCVLQQESGGSLFFFILAGGYDIALSRWCLRSSCLCHITCFSFHKICLLLIIMIIFYICMTKILEPQKSWWRVGNQKSQVQPSKLQKEPKDWGSKIIKIEFAFKDTFRSLICCAEDRNFLESLECYLLLLPKRPHLALISEDEEKNCNFLLQGMCSLSNWIWNF